MRNISRNLLIGIGYIAVLVLVLVFGLLAQPAQACALPDNVQALQTATGPLPCSTSTDAYLVNGSKCLLADQVSSDICITQAWMPRSEASYPLNPEPVVLARRPEVVPAAPASLTADPGLQNIRHSRRNSSLSILYCSFQI